MNQRARSLRESGVDVVDLTVGEPDFPTPELVREAAKRAIDAGFTRYTPVAGYTELREAVSRKLLRENGLSYPADRVIVSNGAKHCIANALLALVDPGDEVIVPAPYWVSYVELVKLAGGRPVVLATRAAEAYKLDPGRLEAAMGPRTKALILCSPSNPAGLVYSRGELAAFAAVLERHPRVWVLSDEVYEHINYGAGHASIASFPAVADRVALVNGVSKAYAMTGWRIGYLAGAAPLIKACTDLQGQMTTNASSIAQRAALAALDSGTAEVEPMRAAFLLRRDLVAGALAAMPGLSFVLPQGAFYFFPDISSFYGKSLGERKVASSEDMAGLLLEEGRVATVPGSAFGDDACLRLSFASSEERLAEGLRRIGGTLARLA
jgi:aspartate aminotransferase